jgi:hypothetical protein
MTGLFGFFLPCIAYSYSHQRLQNEDDDEIVSCSLLVCILLCGWDQGTDCLQY